jgi:hypothetical protein
LKFGYDWRRISFDPIQSDFRAFLECGSRRLVYWYSHRVPNGENDGQFKSPTSSQAPPRFYANVVNVASGPFDVTFTFLHTDTTKLPDTAVSETKWGGSGLSVECQVYMSLGHAKAMIPLIVRQIAEFEEKWGVIPSPGFDESAKG